MSYVITEPCVGLCEAECVKVCPVSCIHGPFKKNGESKELTGLSNKEGLQLYIHPTDCIDCGACVPVCPVKAVFAETALPAKWIGYKQKNVDFFK